jgi:hypothetical protein
MRSRRRGYFAFARFCTTTREAVVNLPLEIEVEVSLASGWPSAPNSSSERGVKYLCPIGRRQLCVNCGRWLRLGLADLGAWFFFAPGEEPLDHVERDRN